jgi:hypothetical protein
MGFQVEQVEDLVLQLAQRRSQLRLDRAARPTRAKSIPVRREDRPGPVGGVQGASGQVLLTRGFVWGRDRIRGAEPTGRLTRRPGT